MACVSTMLCLHVAVTTHICCILMMGLEDISACTTSSHVDGRVYWASPTWKPGNSPLLEVRLQSWILVSCLVSWVLCPSCTGLDLSLDSLNRAYSNIVIPLLIPIVLLPTECYINKPEVQHNGPYVGSFPKSLLRVTVFLLGLFLTFETSSVWAERCPHLGFTICLKSESRSF
jgi:hypothetical protein